MTNPRENRGTGNGGKAYRESSFWDNIDRGNEMNKTTQNKLQPYDIFKYGAKGTCHAWVMGVEFFDKNGNEAKTRAELIELMKTRDIYWHGEV